MQLRPGAARYGGGGKWQLGQYEVAWHWREWSTKRHAIIPYGSRLPMSPSGRVWRIRTSCAINNRMSAVDARYYFWYYGFPKPLAEEGLQSV